MERLCMVAILDHSVPSRRREIAKPVRAESERAYDRRMGRASKMLRGFGAHPLITAWMRRFGWRVDRRILVLSGGRFSLNGPSVLLLRTVGRRSGTLRETPVIYIRDGTDLVVASEDFGQSRPANWPLNLAANPAAAVTVGRRSWPVRARALDEEETERYWPRLVEVCPAHEVYRQRSGKRHVFLLSPTEKAGG